MRNNLPPEAQNWVRDVEGRLTTLEKRTTRALDDNTNALKGVNSLVTKLTSQVRAIEEITETLQEQQAELEAAQQTLQSQQSQLASQQSTLANQQSQLASQQANIVALLEDQVEVRDVNAQFVENFSLPTSWTERAYRSLTVPSGYSQALVFATSDLEALNGTNTPTDIGLQVEVDHNATNKFRNNRYVPVQDQTDWLSLGTITLVIMDRITNLSGGDTISARAEVVSRHVAIPANSTNFCSLNLAAFFLK